MAEDPSKGHAGARSLEESGSVSLSVKPATALSRGTVSLTPPTFEEQIEHGPHSCRSASRLTSSPFPMFLFDRNTGAILDANGAAVRASGWSRESLMGATVADLFPPKGPDGPSFVRLRRWDTLWTGPWIARRRDGSTFFAEVGMMDAGDEEQPAIMVLVVTPESPTTSGRRVALASGA